MKVFQFLILVTIVKVAGDFIQEEANKTVKSFLLPGMPSSEIWKRVCRKAVTLKELKESVCDTTAGKRHLHKVTMIRREIRVQNFASPFCMNRII